MGTIHPGALTTVHYDDDDDNSVQLPQVKHAKSKKGFPLILIHFYHCASKLWNKLCDDYPPFMFSEK